MGSIDIELEGFVQAEHRYIINTQIKSRAQVTPGPLPTYWSPGLAPSGIIWLTQHSAACQWCGRQHGLCAQFHSFCTVLMRFHLLKLLFPCCCSRLPGEGSTWEGCRWMGNQSKMFPLDRVYLAKSHGYGMASQLS